MIYMLIAYAIIAVTLVGYGLYMYQRSRALAREWRAFRETDGKP